jgi:hypothetical protein
MIMAIEKTTMTAIQAIGIAGVLLDEFGLEDAVCNVGCNESEMAGVGELDIIREERVVVGKTVFEDTELEVVWIVEVDMILEERVAELDKSCEERDEKLEANALDLEETAEGKDAD